MYAFCRRCRTVYDVLALHRGRPYIDKCPECDVPLHAPSAKRLRLIELRREERRQRD
jgi:hypothetical protein